jgi:isoquinoline 1-oxidoreductase beta subunit
VSAPVMISRRGFLRTSAAVGGGLLVTWNVPLQKNGGESVAAGKDLYAVNAFVRSGTDESVTVISAHSEMGQGIYTSLPMLLNEELQADWAKIRVEAAPVDKVYNHPVFGIQMTGGSTTSPAEWTRYRKMGAVARVMLVQAAAKQWGVDPASCRVEKGVVIHEASKRRATYGALASAASQLTAPADVPLKDPKQFTLIGKRHSSALMLWFPEWSMPLSCAPRCSAAKYEQSTPAKHSKFPVSKWSNKFLPASR